MAARKPPQNSPKPATQSAESAVLKTDSAAAGKPTSDAGKARGQQVQAVDETVEAIAFNANKAQEYGPASAKPAEGQHVARPDCVGASTVSESNRNDKTGNASPTGVNAASGELPRVRADSGGQVLTTNLGVPVADNQSSLKVGLRGPVLLKDFILREKITHFDHERIPERIVHARGSAAHGYFECYESLQQLTCASLFAEAGKRTPVFVRFSTVAGERGSKDTARDARGFAVKFYTDQGNWDLVGNNIPVFFIQDAMKFPDLVHAVKPEPHHGMPQAASAHDTFWDFISLMPEAAHMIMWVMSDRGIPRSYRMMQGFGVHSFRFVTAEGTSSLIKLHWNPKLGTHSHVWDEAVKISGADPDYHRRDLWEAIEAGEYPEWELGVQVISDEQAEAFSFDVLDATKLIPEELVPVQPIGRLVLNRNPDNFFAETEQVAFCAAHVVPGIDFSNDPLLAGRIHSYVDTQITRLGGANFQEIPINAPLAPVHNNQRDGMHRQTVHRGRVAYEPNSLGGGCPHQAGAAGFVPFPEPVQGDELRGKPEKFAEHYLQASLFYNSQAPHEQQHIIDALRFELSKVTVPGIRQRMLALLRNIAEPLAEGVAAGLGMALPAPLPNPAKQVKPEVSHSPALSLLARPGDGGIRTRQVAVLVAAGADAASLREVVDTLQAQGAVVRLVGPRIGAFTCADGSPLDADASLENQPAPLFDAVAVADGEAASAALQADGRAIEFVRDAFRHGKSLLALGAGAQLLEQAGIALASAPPGVYVGAGGDAVLLQAFIQGIAQHRHPERETNPPMV